MIEIIAPAEDEHLFVCRKGYHALNLLTICDAKLKILYFVARWPGSTHDSYAWENSALRQYFSPNHHNRVDGLLLGDSAYTLSNHMLTPFTNPTSQAEIRYNTSHCATRNPVERCFGVLKGQFRCLHSILHYDPLTASAIASTCACLHNKARF